MVLLLEMGKLGKELIWSLNLGILNFKYSIFQLKMASRRRMALKRKTDIFIWKSRHGHDIDDTCPKTLLFLGKSAL